MNDDLDLLVTIMYSAHEELVRVAVRIEHGLNRLPTDGLLEPASKAVIAAHLPARIRDLGPICNVEMIEIVAPEEAAVANAGAANPVMGWCRECDADDPEYEG